MEVDKVDKVLDCEVAFLVEVDVLLGEATALELELGEHAHHFLLPELLAFDESHG
jgi:hypothetical protein